MRGLLYHRRRRWSFLLLTVLLAGCSTYYGQLVQGQLALLRARQPVREVLEDPARPAALRTRLQHLLQARQFASDRLGLPDNDSYRLYADIQRPYVVWNVFATPEFSVEAISRCFPVAGCVAYQGYFHSSAARAEAARLSLAGLDTQLAGVDAYSTLGWFADPLLSAMLRRDDEQLAGIIFHELAHQRLYLPGDTAFNESYASFVEHEGQRQWLHSRGLPPPGGAREQAYRQLVSLVLETRERLRTLYASGQPPDRLRQQKQKEFMRLRQAYRRLRDRDWQGQDYFRSWISQPLNNASLLPFGLYDGWLPAFSRLFQDVNRDWEAFHLAVRALADLPDAGRRQQLQRLMARAGARAGQP